VLPCFPVGGALSEHGTPEAGRLIVIAALLGQCYQVVPGEVAVDALIDTGRTNGSFGRSASSLRRILQSRLSFRARTSRSVYPVWRTMTSVQCTGTFARLRVQGAADAAHETVRFARVAGYNSSRYLIFRGFNPAL